MDSGPLEMPAPTVDCPIKIRRDGQRREQGANPPPHNSITKNWRPIAPSPSSGP